MEYSVSEKSQINVSSVDESLSIFKTKSRRISLDSISIINTNSIIAEDIKERIEISPDKRKLIRKKSFVWSDESRFNDSKIEIFCGITQSYGIVH